MTKLLNFSVTTEDCTYLVLGAVGVELQAVDVVGRARDLSLDLSPQQAVGHGGTLAHCQNLRRDGTGLLTRIEGGAARRELPRWIFTRHVLIECGSSLAAAQSEDGRRRQGAKVPQGK